MALPSLANPKHEQRYHKHKVLGMPVEEIAREEKVTEKTVRDSIKAVQLQRSLATKEEAELGQFATINAVREAEEKALLSALQAGNADGKPDHKIQLQAVDRVNEKLAALQPRTRGTNISVGVGVGVNQKQPVGEDHRPVDIPVTTGRRPTSFEEIVRQLDAEDSGETKALPEGEVEIIEPRQGESAAVHQT